MMDELKNMVTVTPSKKALKTVKPIWDSSNELNYEHEYFDAVDITMPKHEWERVKRIVEIFDMTNRHPAMRDLAMQYHMMHQLIKKELE